MSTALRENLITNAVEFLTDPKVQGAAEDRKKSFLKSKGMNEAEISEAIRRASGQLNNPAIAGNVHMPPGQMVLPAPHAQPQYIPYTWKTLGFLFLVCTGLGQLVHYLIKRYLAPIVNKYILGSDPKANKITAKAKATKAANEKLQTEVKEAISLISQYFQMQAEKEKIQNLMLEQQKENERTKLELIQAEMSSLRVLCTTLAQARETEKLNSLSASLQTNGQNNSNPSNGSNAAPAALSSSGRTTPPTITATPSAAAASVPTPSPTPPGSPFVPPMETGLNLSMRDSAKSAPPWKLSQSASRPMPAWMNEGPKLGFLHDNPEQKPVAEADSKENGAQKSETDSKQPEADKKEPDNSGVDQKPADPQ